MTAGLFVITCLATRAFAKQLEVAEFTIRLLVHEDLRYQSYLMRQGQFMSQKNPGKPCHLVQALVEQATHPEEPDMLWFFSDENNFDQDEKVNRRNDGWLCASSNKVSMVMWTKSPSSAMVLVIPSNEGHVVPRHFFQQRLWDNSKA